MTRIEAIARLRELADRLEAAGDSPHSNYDGFNVTLHAHIRGQSEAAQAGNAQHWIDAMNATTRESHGGDAWYWNAGQSAIVFCPASYHHLAAHHDLLANRDVQVLEIGGAA